MIAIKTPAEIILMRESCRLAAKTLVFIEPFIKPGVSTNEINVRCHEYIKKNGAIPSPLNYHGFPKSICTSRNEVICHGIPSEKDIICDGDIINVDVTVYKNGFHGDTNKTFLVGAVSPIAKKLVEVTFQCLWAGINEIRPGVMIGNIGAAISHLAHKNKYSVVEEYCGHGIGREFHEAPQVLHFSKWNTGIELRPGMVFTVEPMINLGRKGCKLLSDNWTVVTVDGKLSAQFEHTVLVTETGYEVLTLLE